MDSDAAYFARRAEEERAAAEAASHPRAREAHATLARLYGERANEQALEFEVEPGSAAPECLEIRPLLEMK